MVAFQMAVSVILLTGSSLFFHSFMVARNTDPGFRTEGVVSVQVDLAQSGLPESEWDRIRWAVQGIEWGPSWASRPSGLEPASPC